MYEQIQVKSTIHNLYKKSKCEIGMFCLFNLSCRIYAVLLIYI